MAKTNRSPASTLVYSSHLYLSPVGFRDRGKQIAELLVSIDLLFFVYTPAGQLIFPLAPASNLCQLVE